MIYWFKRPFSFLPVTLSPKFLSRFTGSERTYGAAKIRLIGELKNCFSKIFHATGMQPLSALSLNTVSLFLEKLFPNF